MKIGAQFYTIRDCCRNLTDLEESLKKVADIGYRHIQLSGVCPYEADWMDEKLRALGLSCDITHFDYNRIVHDTAGTVAFHDRMGCKYIGIGGNPKGVNPAGLDLMAEDLASVLPVIRESGHKFMYHSHHMEFAHFDGKIWMDMLCDRFPADLLGVTLDTYWAQAGGADPAFWLRKLKGRVDCVHFKDMVYWPEDKNVRMAPIGSGNMNYPEIFKACEDAGVLYGFVEQDNCYGEDPFSCLKKSFEYLTSFGLEA